MSQSRSRVEALNPYAAIAGNKRRTVGLVVSFILVIGIGIWALGVVLGVPVLDSIYVGEVGTALALVGAFIAYRTGDSIVLRIADARPATKAAYPQLFRTVENLCIGSGTPVPRVFVIEDNAPNAFATGRDPDHATIAVTTGLLNKLEPLELEGVIAHELAHIMNMDIRLMMMTAVLVGIIAVVADITLRATWYGAGSRNRYKGKGEGGGAIVLVAIAAVAMIVVPIIARLIQYSISRQREFLADASGVLLTRYPEGLASALEKISRDSDPLDEATKGTAHMYFVNPLAAHSSGLNNMYSSHPPIKDRVERLRNMMGVTMQTEE